MIDLGQQSFRHGDLVHIAPDLGSSMSHFPSDCDAIVIASYAHQYGGSDHDSFTLFLRGQGNTSWYQASQLALLEHDRHDLLASWQKEIDDERTLKSNLDWIFAHGDELLTESCAGASVEALASTLGIDNLWGAQGEGFVYTVSAQLVLELAEPYLRAGNKEGWLAFCRSITTTQHDKES